jgi:hypothetical protein
MQKWEYKKQSVWTDEDMAKADELGEEGWELVSVCYNGNGGYNHPTGYFKRSLDGYFKRPHEGYRLT